MPEFLLAAIDHTIPRHHSCSEIIVFERISSNRVCRGSSRTVCLNVVIVRATGNFLKSGALLEKESSGKVHLRV